MKIIQTPNAPAAIGPYSQAVVVGDLLFTSGQIPLRADGTLNDGDITVQTTQVFANLKAVIEAAGGSLNQVIKTTVFLKNLDDYVAMNTVYGESVEPLPFQDMTVYAHRDGESRPLDEGYVR